MAFVLVGANLMLLWNGEVTLYFGLLKEDNFDLRRRLYLIGKHFVVKLFNNNFSVSELNILLLYKRFRLDWWPHGGIKTQCRYTYNIINLKSLFSWKRLSSELLVGFEVLASPFIEEGTTTNRSRAAGETTGNSLFLIK